MMEDADLLLPEVEIAECARAHAGLDAWQIVEIFVEQLAAVALAVERVAVRGAVELFLGPRDVLAGCIHQVDEVEVHLVRIRRVRAVREDPREDGAWVLKVMFGKIV